MPGPLPAMADPEWAIYVRDTSLNRIAQIEDYDRLEFTSRFNAVGAWQLDLDRRVTGAAQLFTAGNAIVITRNGTTMFAGPVVERKEDKQGNIWKATITGVDDMVWLQRRLASPEPATAMQPYSTNAYDVRTGTTSTIMRQYVDNNAGPSALAARKVPGLVLAADPLIGTSQTGRARWQILIDLLNELALTGGTLGFTVLQSGATLVFSIYQPQNKTSAALFTEEIGNLSSYNFILDAPVSNFVYVGGGGELTARVHQESSDPVEIVNWGRIEKYVDARHTSVVTELQAEASKNLLADAEKATVNAVPIDTGSMAFGTHYNLGDRVTVILTSGARVVDLVREFKVVLTPAGPQSFTPMIGTPGRLELLAMLGVIRDLSARLRDLERR